MIIQVTQDCIDIGDRGSSTSCPIAFALHDAGFLDAYVNGLAIRAGGIWRRHSHVTRQFVAEFDTYAKSKAEPFEFDLDALDLDP